MTRLFSAPVRARDDLEHVAIEIFEINAATTVVIVNFVRPRFQGICPVTQALVADPRERCVKFALVDKKCVVLNRDRSGLLHEIERNVVGQLHHHEMVKRYCGRAAENFDQKRRGSLLVAAPDDRMIQLNWHDGPLHLGAAARRLFRLNSHEAMAKTNLVM